MLPRVNGRTLTAIIAYLRHHAAHDSTLAASPVQPRPLASADLRQAVDAWDAAFVDVADTDVFHLYMVCLTPTRG